MLDALFNLIFARIITTGALEVVTGSGQIVRFGEDHEPDVRIRFTSPKAQRQFTLDPELKLGELYMDGDLRIEKGDIYDFVSLLLVNRSRGKLPTLFRLIGKAHFLIRRFLQRNGLTRARSNVAHHYDLDGRLYDLFLDEDRQYSCAYFEQPGMTLDEAQLAKKRHIAAKLCINGGERVLDIGCGWGGMALYLHRVAGAGEVVGVTLSEEQIGIARRRALEAGVDRDVRFEMTDYREVSPSFDRIVSVGMFEHVGLDYYDVFFRKVAELLTEDGVALLHTIGNAGVPTFTNAWIAKYIFPGGYIPALSEVLPAIERAGLLVTDIEILRLHYAETLKAWRERFIARREEAVQLYDERFALMWEFYLAACEMTFRKQAMMNFQIQLTRRQGVVPMTREYLPREEARLRAREGATQPRLKLAGE